MSLPFPNRICGGWIVRIGRVFLLVALCLGESLATWAAAFTATLDRNTISVGESATLSLTFEGGTPKSLPPIRVPQALSLQSAGQSTQMIMEGLGPASTTISYNYQVTASQPGDYLIPAIQVDVDGQTLSSQPLRLKVTRSSTNSGLAFLKLVPSKDTVYIGEPFALEIQLYLAVPQDSLQMPLVEGDGFVFGKIGQPAQSRTQVGNQIYTVGIFRLSAVAAKTGTLNLGPAQCSLVLHVPASMRSRSLFDDFFGGQRKPVTLTSEPQSMTVLPLPDENRPPSFNGAVGSFSFNASATPTNVTSGDPITLKLQVAGQGNLEALPFPGGKDWPGFTLYPPTSKVETTDPAGLSGVKTFERVVIPQGPDVKEVPAISFSFFDPEQKAYRTLRQPATPITVRPAAVAQPTVLANSHQEQEPPQPTRDIVHVKPYLGTVTALETPLILRPWFLALQGVPIVAWLSALLWRKRRDQLQNNPRLRRRLRVAETVRRGLADLRRLAQGNESDAFFATVFRLLQEQLGERLNLPASAITESVLEERLRGRAPEGLVAQLHDLFQACNQARYAPHQLSQELMALVPRIEAALRQLRQLPNSVDRTALRLG